MPANGYPTPPLTSGTTARATILEGYVFASGLHDPEHSKILTYKYPQYYMTTLLDKLGAEAPVAQTVFSWSILDRTRKSSTATTVTNGTTATASVVTTIASDVANGNKGYYIIGDVVRTEAGELGRVVAIGESSLFQTIDVVRVVGGNWSASLIANGFVLGHVFNSFGEATAGPEGRLYLPSEDFNYTQILKRGDRKSVV